VEQVDTVVEIGRRGFERLTQVLFFEFRVLLEQLGSVRVKRHGLKDTAHSEAHPADTRLPVHDVRVHCTTSRGNRRGPRRFLRAKARSSRLKPAPRVARAGRDDFCGLKPAAAG
jgi:hypothetical protein